MKNRTYYKLFTGTRQKTSSYIPLKLAYSTNNIEIVLYDDQITYFHVPFFSNPISIHDTKLIESGATPGHVPACSDRIMKYQGGYGQNTPHGWTNYMVDGMWFCSWLKYDPNGNHTWMDRFYNPGRVSIQEVLEGDVNEPNYIKNDPVFIDLPSTLILEPTTWFRYFHAGRQNAKDFVTKFAGLSSQRLLLDLTNWYKQTFDKSIYRNKIFLNTEPPSDWLKVPFAPTYFHDQPMNFDTSFYQEFKVEHSPSYTPEYEFTLSFWCYSKDWHSSPSTQLVGNYTAYGGYGVFIDTLSSYPYFVVPETKYGHLFYINEKLNWFRDKTTQQTFNVLSSPKFVALDRFSNVVIFDTNGSGQLQKMDHLGNVLSIAMSANQPIDLSQETPIALTQGLNNTTTLWSTTSAYVFDDGLNLIQILSNPSSVNDTICYDTNGQPHLINDAFVGRFVGDSLWWVKRSTKELFFENQKLSNNVIHLAVHPDQTKIYALHDNNKVTVWSIENKQILKQSQVGPPSVVSDIKNSSFIRIYNRTTQTYTWKYLFYTSLEKNLYIVDPETLLTTKIIDLQQGGETLLYSQLNQTSDFFEFAATGDFTGYEYKRIFMPLEFQNSPQIVVKFSTLYRSNVRTEKAIDRKTIILNYPINHWTNNDWYQLAVTHTKNTISLFVNSKKVKEVIIPSEVVFNTELQSSLCIGTPSGKTANYNLELQTDTVIFNGAIDSVQIYNYPLTSNELNVLKRSKRQSSDIYWNIPTPNIQFIESIQHFFKHKKPGMKSQFFKVRIKGSQITNPLLRERIEKHLESIISETQPAYSHFLGFIWED